jgi:L-ascorbate metabolism protein UlaG (beta-lactamase superfamily)
LGDAIEIAKEKNATILAQPEIVNYVTRMNVKQTIKLHYGGRITLDFGNVKMVPAWYSSSLGEEGLYGGNPCGYVVNFLGHIFYHAGDTALFGDMKIIGESDPVEVAMLPIGDRYTMGIDYAVKAVSLIKPQVVIPMHFNTFDVIVQDPEEFKRKVEHHTTARCVVLKPGQHFEFK